MQDGRLRIVVKAVARTRFALDLRLARAWRRRRRTTFDLGGECRRCARCCEAPSIRAHALVWHLRSLRAVFLWWQEAVNGFVLVRAARPERLFEFRCTHFDPETRACDSYHSRPGLCRDYPRVLLAQPRPEFLPGCGYRALLPGRQRFLQALEAQPLTSDQKARLKADLHLE